VTERRHGAMRRRLLKAVGLAVALAPFDAALAQRPRARPNYEYFEIPPQPVTSGSRIEVIEFFWYGCPYCYQLEPFLAGWLGRKPADVEFRLSPAIFRQSWIAHARLFHVLDALGELPRLHRQVYQTIHVESRPPEVAPGAAVPHSTTAILADAESTTAWAVEHGIERERWLKAYEDPQIDRRIEQSVAATRNYQIKGTPSLVVDGRYVTSTGMSETISGVIGILDDLVQIARERRAKP
jgi:thiol:disulfide interchange protein DsbA